MKKKVIMYNSTEQTVVEDLNERYDFHMIKKLDLKTNQDFFIHTKKAEEIISLSLEVDNDLFDKSPHLKINSNNTVRYNNLDIEELRKSNIMATNTPGILTDTVADTIFGLLISTARRMPELDHWVKAGNWTGMLETAYFGTDVHHKTLGIIGMGRIGQAIAKRAFHGFDMNILYHTRTKKPEAEQQYNASYCSMVELLTQSDFVCLMTPLTPETEQLIGKREFQLMKKSAIFINGSRGKTIVEQDLIDALQNG